MSDLNYGIKLELGEASKHELRQILTSIGDELIGKLSWKVQLEFFVVHHESEFAQNAEFVAPIGDGWIQYRTDRRPWRYEQLARFSREKIQVMDGEFIGYKTTPKGKKKWVVLKAVDGSFWEFWTEDRGLFEKVSGEFSGTKEVIHLSERLRFTTDSDEIANSNIPQNSPDFGNQRKQGLKPVVARR